MRPHTHTHALTDTCGCSCNALCTFMQVLKPVIRQLEQKVQKGVLAIRAPLNLAADVGLRDNLLSMLCCYNPLWLRLALEAVSCEMLAPGHALNDTIALRRFADRRVLSAQCAVQEVAVGAHPEEKLRQAKSAEVDQVIL